MATVDEKTRKHIDVIDCTLRDGEQAPGVWFTVAEKVELATLLDHAGVDVLDAGFPAASAADKEAMQEMKHNKLNAKIAATARAVHGDVVAAKEALADEVFLFMPTSEKRIANTLKMDFETFKKSFRKGAEHVVSEQLGLNIVCEDATRTSQRNIVEIIEALSYDLPIKRVILADSVGCATPSSIRPLFSNFARWLDSSIDLCAHCHDDFGLATANTLVAVAAGAGAVTCTVNAIGERAGNADLAEVVMGLAHLYSRSTNVVAEKLTPLSHYVERISGFVNAPHKAVTGFNVFRHESGVHVDSMLKDSGSYEFLPAAALGRQTEFVLGKHSGSALIKHLLQRESIEYDDRLIDELLYWVKDTINLRSKSAHQAMSEQQRIFNLQHLSGVSCESLIELARKKRQEMDSLSIETT